MGTLSQLWNGAISTGSAVGSAGNAAFIPNATGGAATARGAIATGTGLQMTGAALQGFDSLATALYQAKVGENNAKILDENAQQALQAGTTEESIYRTRAGQVRGARNAALAAGNIDVASPLAQQLEGSDNFVENLDASTIRYNAEREAYNQRLEAMGARTQAGLTRELGVGGLAKGLAKVGESYISGATSLATKWDPFKSAGLING